MNFPFLSQVQPELSPAVPPRPLLGRVSKKSAEELAQANQLLKTMGLIQRRQTSATAWRRRRRCDCRSDGDKVAVPPAMLLCCSIKYKARTAQRFTFSDLFPTSRALRVAGDGAVPSNVTPHVTLHAHHLRLCCAGGAGAITNESRAPSCRP